MIELQFMQRLWSFGGDENYYGYYGIIGFHPPNYYEI